MELLKSLGVNSTLWYQLACFIVSYLALSNLILKPYMAALHERENRTVGGEETAIRLIEEASHLHAELEQKARAIHASVKHVYDSSRTEAMAEYDRTIQKARVESQELLTQSRGSIQKQIQSVHQTLLNEIPIIGNAIASKLVGKDFPA